MNNFEVLQQGLQDGRYALVSIQVGESTDEIDEMNEAYGLEIPHAWLNNYAHSFLAWFSNGEYYTSSCPLVCTSVIENQVNDTVTEVVKTVDKALLKDFERFHRAKTVFHFFPYKISSDVLIAANKKVFDAVRRRHSEGTFKYSYAKNQPANESGCCQLIARTILEQSNVNPPAELPIPNMLELSWKNFGKLEI